MSSARDDASRIRLRRLSTPDLEAAELLAIRALLDDAFGDDEEERFEEDDWLHALGGTHVVLDVDGSIVAHAAVVERELRIGGRPVRTGYVEAVAVAPAEQRRGYGTRVMRDIGAIIDAQFELGALGTGSHGFYERLGWQVWLGPSSVRLSSGEERPTPDEDGYIMVHRTPSSPTFAQASPISANWRPGDAW